MKTAISIPDSTFEQAEAAAQAMGVSRSEFYRRAAELLIRASSSESVTARVDATLARAGGGGGDADFAVAAGQRILIADGDDW
ncbi:CopG family ribbon-helix-helix protein [Zafaria sp. Z1313]|uniref:CopG family ribbon-helix-helix protein n=1 Tax=Zafaria sp. Z1313 TaxID=3423202 RepID=UPI003D3025DC